MHKRGGGSGGEKYQGGGKKGNPMENRRRISFFLDFSLTLANSFESNPMGWRRRQKRQNGNHHHWVLKMDGGGEFFEPTIGYAVGTAQTLALIWSWQVDFLVVMWSIGFQWLWSVFLRAPSVVMFAC